MMTKRGLLLATTLLFGCAHPPAPRPKAASAPPPEPPTCFVQEGLERRVRQITGNAFLAIDAAPLDFGFVGTVTATTKTPESSPLLFTSSKKRREVLEIRIDDPLCGSVPAKLVTVTHDYVSTPGIDTQSTPKGSKVVVAGQNLHVRTRALDSENSVVFLEKAQVHSVSGHKPRYLVYREASHCRSRDCEGGTALQPPPGQKNCAVPESATCGVIGEKCLLAPAMTNGSCYRPPTYLICSSTPPPLTDCGDAF